MDSEGYTSDDRYTPPSNELEIQGRRMSKRENKSVSPLRFAYKVHDPRIRILDKNVRIINTRMKKVNFSSKEEMKSLNECGN